MYSLVSVANMLMGFMGKGGFLQTNQPKERLMKLIGSWINNIVDAIKLVLGPILIVVAAAGSIYANCSWS